MQVNIPRHIRFLLIVMVISTPLLIGLFVRALTPLVIVGVTVAFVMYVGTCTIELLDVRKPSTPRSVCVHGTLSGLLLGFLYILLVSVGLELSDSSWHSAPVENALFWSMLLLLLIGSAIGSSIGFFLSLLYGLYVENVRDD